MANASSTLHVSDNFRKDVYRGFSKERIGMGIRVFVLFVVLGGLAGPGVAQDSLEKAVSWLREAEGLLRQEDYESAAKQARRATEYLDEVPELLQRAAEILYRAGYAEDSLPLFQRVVEHRPERAAHNWQRGIALCTCGRWREGAEQFKTHHDVNPDDVENSAWYFLCIAKTKGIEAARKTVIPSRGDGRQPMMSVLKMLKGEIEPDAVIEAAGANTSAGLSRKRALFYADLYVGLYLDCLGEEKSAAKYLRRSLTHGIDGYMADTARVYEKIRLGGMEK